MRKRGDWMAHIVRLLLLVWFGLVLAHVRPAAQDSAEALAHRIEVAHPGATRELGSLTMAELLLRTKVPGVSVSVIKDSAIHFAKAYGLADIGAKRPVEVGTLSRRRRSASR